MAQNFQNSILSGSQGGRGPAGKFYPVLILIVAVALIWAASRFNSPRDSVEKTLPPGVPLEAPPLDQLPGASE